MAFDHGLLQEASIKTKQNLVIKSQQTNRYKPSNNFFTDNSMVVLL